VPDFSFPTQNFTIPVHPTIQHIPKAHIACEVLVPPVYATEVPTFTISAVVKVPYKVDRYAGLGKGSQSNEEKLIVAQLESLKRAFRNMQVTGGLKT